MADAGTIRDLIEVGIDSDPAVGAPGRGWLSYAGLRRLAADTVAVLNGLGIGRNDRVAMVLPNGPEMACAFVAVATGATAAPLDPAYRADEYRFHLSDLAVKALLVEEGSDSEAVAVAGGMGIPILDLALPADRPAGAFEIKSRDRQWAAPAAVPGPAEAGDTALVLHTSGTTSRPKMVPLTHTHIRASADNIRASLGLEAGDRCLNIMPLFHVHGLAAGLLASLAGGGSVFCAPGFDTFRFFSWLEEAEATWYTAVPTMHQAILARAGRNRGIVDGSRLRFVRSSSAPLPPTVMKELEECFGVPAVEAYGMTEAAHQISTNPLPPRRRLPGSVGMAVGSELAVMDERGRLLAPGQEGEVVIRGGNVFLGYETDPSQNPAANDQAFTDGWFRTGDQGVMDRDGYLCLTGRLKEIINRGGEKISPIEVDNVLMDHPAISQAVTFAVPHEKLGEEVAAAVVLSDSSTAGDREIREFASQRLAAFKVPRHVLIVDEIPKGATGKPQRIGLAEKLGLA